MKMKDRALGKRTLPRLQGCGFKETLLVARVGGHAAPGVKAGRNPGATGNVV